MGICTSLCSRGSPAADESRLAADLAVRSDSSSDSSLKAKATGSRKAAPPLTGPSGGFPNLSLSSTSSSVDLEIDELAQMMKPPSAKPEERQEPVKIDRTFKDVNPDLDLNNIPSSDDSDKIV
jgi:hypothetical protein